MNKIHYVVICLFLISCGEEASKTDRQKAPPTVETIQVHVGKCEKKPFEHSIKALGKIAAHQMTKLSFRRQGTVKAIHKHNGQWVNQGQVIATLDQSEWLLALNKAQNDYQVKREAFVKELIDYGGDPNKKNGGIDAKLYQRIWIRQGLKATQLQIQEAQQNLQYANLIAPFTGIIADQNLHIGSQISPNTHFCTLYTKSQLTIEVEVLESEVGLLSMGQAAKIHALAYPDTTFDAKIIELNPLVSNNGMMKVKLQLLNTSDLVVGMNAQAEIIVPQKETLVIPKSALVIRQEKKVVFTISKGIAQWHYVKTGFENSKEIEILEGLKAGDQVILDNNLQLVHDSPVKVIP